MSLTPEQQKIAEQFYYSHAITPDEVRYLAAYRRLPPEFREHVSAMADLLLLRGVSAPPLTRGTRDG